MDINQRRQMAASKCTDIIVLVYAALCHAYDLQTYLEFTGEYKHEKKMSLNRTLAVLNNIYSRIGYGFQRNETFKKNTPLLCDEFIGMVDSHIGMEWDKKSKELNIIDFCCRRAYKYATEVIRDKALFSVIPYIARDLSKIPAMLHPFQYEKQDLSFIFNQQLKNLYAERKYE